jgi:cytochrome b561
MIAGNSQSYFQGDLAFTCSMIGKNYAIPMYASCYWLVAGPSCNVSDLCEQTGKVYVALTQAPGYGIVAKVLHWLIFALLAVQYAIGSIMPHIGRHTQDEGWVSWHFSVGAAILFFILIRLIWRLFHPVPQLPTLAPLERVASGLVHWALYLLVLAMTLLGWAATNSRGWNVKLFGIITLPSVAPKGSHWGHECGDIHNVLVYVLLAFIVLHVAGAAYHYFVKHDEMAARMVPGLGRAEGYLK